MDVKIRNPRFSRMRKIIGTSVGSSDENLYNNLSPRRSGSGSVPHLHYNVPCGCKSYSHGPCGCKSISESSNQEATLDDNDDEDYYEWRVAEIDDYTKMKTYLKQVAKSTEKFSAYKMKDEVHAEIAKMTIDCFNSENETKFEFEKVVNVRKSVTRYIDLNIIFTAVDKSAEHAAPGTFLATVIVQPHCCLVRFGYRKLKPEKIVPSS